MSKVVIIPAYNEEVSIGSVLKEIPEDFRSRVIVVDNNSADNTTAVAKSHGAIVLRESEQGYGAACLCGIQYAKEKFNPETYIFLDGDFSDDPADMTKIYRTLRSQGLDLVIGSRNLGLAEPGALLPQARFGNWLATLLMAVRFNYRFTDLGPFRAISAHALYGLDMKDRNFGWTMEMQVKALAQGLKVSEVSVHYKKRIGASKITGTVKGTVLAGYKILWTLLRYSFRGHKTSNLVG